MPFIFLVNKIMYLINITIVYETLIHFIEFDRNKIFKKKIIALLDKDILSVEFLYSFSK